MANPGLVELATAEQSNAKRLLYRRIPICHLSAAALTVAALFLPLPWTYFLGVGVFALQAVAWLLRGKAARLSRLAEEARRRALLIDALGESGEQLDVAWIRLRFSKRACSEAASMPRREYWSSPFPQGPRRLLVLLQESAFFSHVLYAAAARIATWLLGGIIAALVIVVLVSIGAFDGDAKLAVARVVVVALSALITLDVFGHVLAWRSAAQQSETVDRRLERLDGTALAPILAVVADYAIATASAPPIPDELYEREQDRLTELWVSHRQRAA
jgi:hypothetical protein